MESVQQTQIKIIKGVGILIGILSVLSFVALAEPKPFIIGLVFGAIASVLNFRLIFLTASKAVKLPPPQAQTYTVRNYLIRYSITGVILYMAATENHINIIGVVIGLFSIKWVIIKNEILKVSFFKDIFKRKEEK
ncbi:ATP synthase subunit I [Alkaliphilus transvaalensis]|uniref:ATP synthase subunit I n=1 Tax=Alkaliphilus transvaalensis TaxID=114628 RepID=UPI000479001E|nr:ATP synthase subunit I [Alkaliphilus transvaalensis]